MAVKYLTFQLVTSHKHYLDLSFLPQYSIIALKAPSHHRLHVGIIAVDGTNSKNSTMTSSELYSAPLALPVHLNAVVSCSLWTYCLTPLGLRVLCSKQEHKLMVRMTLRYSVCQYVRHARVLLTPGKLVEHEVRVSQQQQHQSSPRTLRWRPVSRHPRKGSASTRAVSQGDCTTGLGKPYSSSPKQVHSCLCKLARRTYCKAWGAICDGETSDMGCELQQRISGLLVRTVMSRHPARVSAMHSCKN